MFRIARLYTFSIPFSYPDTQFSLPLFATAKKIIELTQARLCTAPRSHTVLCLSFFCHLSFLSANTKRGRVFAPSFCVRIYQIKDLQQRPEKLPIADTFLYPTKSDKIIFFCRQKRSVLIILSNGKYQDAYFLPTGLVRITKGNSIAARDGEVFFISQP